MKNKVSKRLKLIYGGAKIVRKPTVYDVANYFLSQVDYDAGGSMTHLKLQKMVYYAQAWCMVFLGKPLFKERFEAWIHGPVCPELWQEYKECGYFHIPCSENVDVDMFSVEQRGVLNDVWDAYGQFDGKHLEELTHQEDPWLEARKGLHPGTHCTNTISLDTMRDYYTKLQQDE